jgi:signal transduction histidine kinase
MRPNAQPTRGDEENQVRQRIAELSQLQLARRLHDGPIQSVAALAMRAHLANRQLASDPAGAAKEVQELEALARRTTQELRYSQFTLTPQSLETAGLFAALQDLVRHLGDLHTPQVQLTLDAEAASTLSADQARQLFHIAAESLENALKHAQSGGVHVRLSRPEPAVLLFEVEDDGVGFDPLLVERSGQEDHKYGLAILRQRAKLLRAELHLRSAAGSGTLLRVAVPLVAAR